MKCSGLNHHFRYHRYQSTLDVKLSIDVMASFTLKYRTSHSKITKIKTE